MHAAADDMIGAALAVVVYACMGSLPADGIACVVQCTVPCTYRFPWPWGNSNIYIYTTCTHTPACKFKSLLFRNVQYSI